jgi:hypothetical protein
MSSVHHPFSPRLIDVACFHRAFDMTRDTRNGKQNIALAVKFVLIFYCSMAPVVKNRWTNPHPNEVSITNIQGN